MKFWFKTTQFFLFLALLTPLFVGLETFIFPFIVPKILFFRIVVELALLSYIILIFRDRSYVAWKQPLTFVASLFVLVAFFSSVFGVDFQHSWWGDFERMEGVFTLVHCAVYVFLLCAVFRTRDDWYRFLSMLAGVSVLVILSGVFQRFADPAHPFLTLGGSRRVYGTLGNYIYFGQYSLFTFWIAGILCAWSKTPLLRYSYACLMALSVWGMILSGSRGPLLGWMMSLIVFGACSLIFFGNARVRIAAGVGTLGMLLVVGLAIFGNVAAFNRIQGLGGLREIATAGGTASTRLMAWDIAWHGFLERPALGWGWGNYYVVYNKFFNPKFLEHGWGETWFDHAHNQYFDMLATTGVIGTLAYVGIFVFATYLLFRAVREKKISPVFFALCMSLLAGHAVNNIFVFEHPSSYLLFFIFLGLIQAETRRVPMVRASQEQLSTTAQIVCGVVVLCTGISLYTGNVLAWKVNVQDRLLQVEFQSNAVAVMPRMMKLAAEAGPYARDVRNDFGLAFLNINRPSEGDAIAPAYIALAKDIVLLQEQNFAAFPLDVRRTMVLVDIYKTLYLLGEPVDGRLEEILAQLKVHSPKRQQLFYYMAELKILQGKYDEAIRIVEETFSPNVRVYQGYWLLAKLEGSRERWKEAGTYLDLAKERGFYPDASTKPLVDIIEQNRTE